jgi:ATP diphosphatase
VSSTSEASSALDAAGVESAPWQHARRLQQCAAEVGFTWPDAGPVLDKLLEEVEELRVELAHANNRQRVEDELGDVLFVLVNLARHAGVDADAALRHANAKFERRFRCMEQLAAADGVDFARCTPSEQEALWQRVKRSERMP